MSRKNVLNRMKQLNISYSQIAQHVMLSSDLIKEWSYKRINIPYKYAWKIYDLLGLDMGDDLGVL